MTRTPVRPVRVVILAGIALAVVSATAAVILIVDSRDKKITESPAVRVELTRTGGMATVNDRFRVNRNAEGTGELFSIVDGARFQSLKREYVPDDACCDRFQYALTARYEDGAVKTVMTVDDADAPDILWRAIRLVTVTRPISRRE